MAPGFFGKLPIKGDFLNRGLSAGFVDDWESWLRLGLAEGQKVFGERWDDVYYEAPVWRFVMPDRVGGTVSGHCGLMMPSVDRVGRRFPLTLAWPCDDGDVTFDRVRQFVPLLEELEARVVSLLLQPSYDFEAFVDAITVECVPDSPPRAADERTIELDESGSLQALWSHAAFLCRHKVLDSLWWTRGSDRISPKALWGPPELSAHFFIELLADDECTSSEQSRATSEIGVAASSIAKIGQSRDWEQGTTGTEVRTEQGDTSLRECGGEPGVGQDAPD